MAELYGLYASAGKGTPDYVLYNIKAIEMMRKVGITHFNYVHNIFFGASIGLYRSNSYKQSINYGLQCLAFTRLKKKLWNPRTYVFQLDIVGAAYLKLGRYDSAKYYYQLIIDTLIQKVSRHYPDKMLWMGIAKGNIGHCLILQGSEQQGIPMVEFQLNVSKQFKAYNNMAMAENILAGIYFKHRSYKIALEKWKNVYYWSCKDGFYLTDQKLLALQGIQKSFQKLNELDSAYKYNELYHKINNERLTDVNAKTLCLLKAKIEFDNIQDNLEDTGMKLQHKKTILNFTLAAILMVTVISGLLYNRQRLKNKYEKELLNRDRIVKELEIKEAKDKISAFAVSMHEKEQLIRDMQKAINENGVPDLGMSLCNYVLITDKEWIKFKEDFTKAYPLFYYRLKEVIPKITPAEERLASLICLQLSNQQIADMLGNSKDSVLRSKRRLKNRITIPEGIAFENYICSLNQI